MVELPRRTAGRLQPGVPSKEMRAVLPWAVAVGVIGGLSSIGFNACVEVLKWLLLARRGGFVEVASGLSPWMRLLVPTFGGLLAGITLHWGRAVLQRHEAVDYMEAIRLGDGTIPPQPTILRSSAALLSIGSGTSIGREGAMVQLSAMFSSWFIGMAHVPAHRRRILVACGAAAGLSAAYHAPIAGAMFIAEVVLGSIAVDSFGPLVVASLSASLVLRYLVGARPIFAVEQFHIQSPWELGAYLVLGLAAGVAGPWFVRTLRQSQVGFKRLRTPLPITMMLGGVLVGAISMGVPAVWGNGYSVVRSMLSDHWLWQIVVGVAVCKVAATAAAIGSGAVGGVFTPTLFVGASVGLSIGIPLHHQWPTIFGSAQSYALVGMGCFLAATTHAPLMAICMVYEMTSDYASLVPLTLACLTASRTARYLLAESMYAPRDER